MLSTVGRFFTHNTGDYFMLNTVGRFINTKYWGILYVEYSGKIYLHKILIILYVKHCDKIYLHKLLRNTVCWALWEDLFTQNTEEYFILSTVGIFIYTKYWGILFVEHCGKIYLYKILRNTVCWTLGRFIYTKYWGILYVEHCEKSYLLNIPRNTVCWALWEDLFTQNTEEYCMLSTEGRFIYTKYWGILYVEHCGKIYLPTILRNTVCWTLGRFIYTKYWGILYVEHCEKIYLHKLLRNTVCWALWDLFTQNTGEYFLLNTVGIFIYIKYWEILYVEHCGKIYLHKYWGILYVEHCGKIYLHKILRNTVCWTLWEDVFT